MKKLFLFFITSILWAQPPEWELNPANYEHVMSVTSIILNNETSSGDVLAAFNEQEDCVGLSFSTTIPFGPHAGQEAFLTQVYSNSFSGGEIISFKFYDYELDSVYFIEETIDFIQDGVFGNVVDPLEFSFSYNNFHPTAENATHTLEEDTIIAFILEAYDADGDGLSYVIVSSPTNGTITLSENVTTYIPNINFSGTDSFQFKVNDGEQDSNVATIVLIVNAVNDAPYLYSIDNEEIFLGESFIYSLQAEDVDGDVLFYTATVSGGSATANINENILTVVPQEPNVTLNVIVTVSDGNATHTVSFVLTVLEEQTSCLDNNSDGWCDRFPTMNIIGESVLLLGVDAGLEYIDEGAACFDSEDGNITHQVEVSGQVVNMSTPNTYEIYYNCSDYDGNAAQTLTRTVVVLPELISDQNEDGFDDDAFMAGAQSGDANQDGSLDVVDIVIFINIILNGE